MKSIVRYQPVKIYIFSKKNIIITLLVVTTDETPVTIDGTRDTTVGTREKTLAQP